METHKRTDQPATRQQLSLIFEPGLIAGLSAKERRSVTTALIELLIEASGLKRGQDHEH